MLEPKRIDRAVERFRRREAALHHEDGGRLYSDEEHERRMEALLADFDREKDRVVAEADRALERAERTLPWSTATSPTRSRTPS